MILAVHQPQYLPWLGYFHKIAACDLFVFLDEVQYKKREFQNRNRIRSPRPDGPRGEEWLTVPVRQSGRYTQKIREVEIDPAVPWARSHLDRIRAAYRAAPYFDALYPDLEKILCSGYTRLQPLCVDLVRLFLDRLAIRTPIRFESEVGTAAASTARLIELCRKTGADTYLSGAGGRDYMDLDLCAREGVRVTFQEFRHPVYRQADEPFLPYLCVLDLLFHEGPASRKILLGGAA